MLDGKSDEEISLFVRDEQNGRFLFNAKALQALGIDPVEAQQRGYPLKEVAEATEELTVGQQPQCMGVTASRKVYCEAFEIGKRAVSESTLVRGAQDHTRRVASLECFLPARGTEAPTVAWVQAWKAKFGYRCRKIVAA